jgi:hypothetical protein
MGRLRCAAIVCCLLFAGCATEPRHDPRSTTGPADEETVLITYHVAPGKEQELREVLSGIWKVYRRERLVFAEPHVILEAQDDAGHKRIVEVFTWVSRSAPDNAPDSVKRLWNRMQACCEQRDGRPGIDGGEVSLIIPRATGR